MPEDLYEDVTEDGFLLHSEKLGDTFIIQVIDLHRNVLIQHHNLSGWGAYSQQFYTSRMALTGLRELIADLSRDPWFRGKTRPPQY